jgi:hypothetical protein
MCFALFIGVSFRLNKNMKAKKGHDDINLDKRLAIIHVSENVRLSYHAMKERNLMPIFNYQIYYSNLLI